jgi:hypothetical protein
MSDQETIITIRKLAALDIAFHGYRFILAEFAAGVILCGGFGAFSLFAFFRNPGSPLFVLILGLVLSWITLNYVPLLLYAIDMRRRKSARQEVAFELEHREVYARKYTLQSLWLLLPLVVPILAIVQEVKKSRSLSRFEE